MNTVNSMSHDLMRFMTWMHPGMVIFLVCVLRNIEHMWNVRFGSVKICFKKN